MAFVLPLTVWLCAERRATEFCIYLVICFLLMYKIKQHEKNKSD